MITTPLFLEVRELREKWGWFLALGVALVILGIVALWLIPAATVATVMVLGWLMVFSGIVEAIHAFRVRGWGGVFLHLVGGVLGVLVGLLIVTHPVAGALVWTLLFASLFTVMGLFRTIAAIHLKFPNWGWAVFDGVVTLALGIMLWLSWPTSALWFLGLAAGVSLVLRGWTYVMLAVAVRSLPARGEVRRAA
jgi:uncharacterized membrane protein HdeD (DUF308 family)